MKQICCADCRYAFFERIYLDGDNWRDDCYCTAGAVIVDIVDPNETHDCSDYWPCP